MEMTEKLFDSIINTAQDCIFWKDSNRRFVGVNQAFLDFYGFDSADVLIGKTDEDMGWHSNPEPFKLDELRVLQGHSTYKVQGKCVIRGEERDIVASKRPIYEGDRIVGLVGSFVDITDVLKRAGSGKQAQLLYTVEQLRKIPFFDKVLDTTPLDSLLDPLTGIINRAYVVNYAHALVAEGKPFTFTMLDLDNFKYINDTYGHYAGDTVLKEVSKGLVKYHEDRGVVGRFGGDELLLINLKDISYDDKESYMKGMYTGGEVLRRNLQIDDKEVFLTGTAGCATFPDNSSSYDHLFSQADHMLYLGKGRGRNCYTIYNVNEHKGLNVQKLAKQGVYTNMNGLMARLEQECGFENRLYAIRDMICTELKINDLYYVGKNNRIHSVSDKSISEDVSDIERVLEDDLYASSDLEGIKERAPLTYEKFRAHDIGAIIIVRIGLNMETDGYLVCAETNNHRIWQEDECGILYFIAKSLAAYIRLSGESIPE